MPFEGLIPKRAAIALAVVVVLTGAGLYLLQGTGGPATEGSVVLSDYSMTYPMVWPAETGRVEGFGGYDIRTAGTETRAELLFSEQAAGSVVAVTTFAVGRDKDEPIKIGSLQWVDSYPTGFYTRNETNITEPSDLEGRRVAMSPRTVTSGLVALGVLKHRYNVTPDDMDIVNRPHTGAIGLLEQGDVDAALIVGPFAIEYRDRFREVVQTTEAFREMHGQYPVNTLIAFQEDEPRENVSAFLTDLRRSWNVGVENVEAVKSAYYNRTSINRTTPIDWIIANGEAPTMPLTSEYRDVIRTEFRYAEEFGVIEEVPDLDASSFRFNQTS